MTITYRLVKGSKLTFAELDGNFTDLDTRLVANPKSGWGYYKDNGATQTFDTTPALLRINGGDAATETAYLPLDIRGSGELWNTSTNRITPVALGDGYNIRLDLTVASESGNPNGLTVELDIQAASSYAGRITILDRLAGTGRSIPYTVSIGVPLFVGATFVANGGQFWVTADTGSVSVSTAAILVQRAHGEVA